MLTRSSSMWTARSSRLPWRMRLLLELLVLSVVIVYLSFVHSPRLWLGTRLTKMASAAASLVDPKFVIPPHRAHGYPTILAGTAMDPPFPEDEPYWYDTESVTKLWNEHLARVTTHRVVQPMQYVVGSPLPPPKPNGHLRFICVSDTHSFHNHLPFPLPAELGIDVLLHAGDFSSYGEEDDVLNFIEWMRSVRVKYKVVIAGNHDVSFDEDHYASHLASRFRNTKIADPKKLKQTLVDGFEHDKPTADNPFPKFAAGGGVAYLEDSGISIEGVRIWGSPWQPEFFDCEESVRDTCE